jgi:hypothetical protein
LKPICKKLLSSVAFNLKLRRYTMAALVAQGCAEIRWLAGKMGARQGLTLVHFSAHPEPFLTHNTP